MNRPIHLLIPMSGKGARYRAAGYPMVKPLIPIHGRPMISRALECFPKEWPTHFVLSRADQSSGLVELLRAERPSAKISFVEPHELGPSHAVKTALTEIPPNDPVFVSYCDYGMDWSPRRFEKFVRATDCAACVVSYRGFHAHYLSPQMYAYCREVENRVREIKEKGCFTDDRETEFASAGGYYFRSAAELSDSIDEQIARDLTHGGELYTSLTVEALLRKNPAADVRVFEIDYFYQWGTPADLQRYEYWEKTFLARLRHPGGQGEVEQVLLPMAGLGSRLKSVAGLPKPLVEIDGRPMFRRALASLPRSGNTTIVTVAEVAALNPERHAGEKWKVLSETPAGQALTVEAGLTEIDLKTEVIVTACDHDIVLDEKLWKKFRADPDCDAAIFTVRGFPGVVASPRSFSYVAPADETDCPRVKRVSVKEPISQAPVNDPLLVGTFWFRTGEILSKGISELKKRGTRVNNELYLDSVFEILAAEGLRVRMVPLLGYLNWGDPHSLAESLYWSEVFEGRRFDRRRRFPGVEA